MHSLLISLLLTAAPQWTPAEWQIDGVTREAFIAVPKDISDSGAPVVFVFHGHGGNARNVARKFHIHALWPEAVVVYPQGLPTPGRLTDPQGKRTGWQHAAGELNDRDLKFFDAILARLRQQHPIDATRIYATGHSNGGGFTYLLWSERPDVLAAVAPSSAAARRIRSLTPKPALHIAGENDRLVRYEWQQRMMQRVRQTNGCKEQGTEWSDQGLLYPSPGGTPFVSLIHPGGHKFLPSAPPLIVRFFQEHRLSKPTEGT